MTSTGFGTSPVCVLIELGILTLFLGFQRGTTLLVLVVANVVSTVIGVALLPWIGRDLHYPSLVPIEASLYYFPWATALLISLGLNLASEWPIFRVFFPKAPNGRVFWGVLLANVLSVGVSTFPVWFPGGFVR